MHAWICHETISIQPQLTYFS